MQLPRTPYDFTAYTSPDYFGALLKWLRDRHGLAQADIITHLPSTIDQQRYSSFELDKRRPLFDELPVIYQALKDAEVRLTLRDRNLFLALAKGRLEAKRTHKVRKSPQEWDDMRAKLAEIDKLPDIPSASVETSTTRSAPLPSRMEISHLIGRDQWLDSLYDAIVGPPSIKWGILQGPSGIGKTSELHRIATYFQQHIPRYYVVLCQLPEREQEAIGADLALEFLLSDILEGIGLLNASLPAESLQTRMKYVLDCLARADRPVLLLLDNAEHLLDEQGDLVPTWRQFYKQFVHARHHASLVLATKEWPTRFTLETQWARQSIVPALSHDEGIVLLQRLGLHDLPEEQLGHVVEVVGGIPVCLEWVTKLMREPLLQGDWSAFEDEEEHADSSTEKAKAQHLAHLLEDPSLFGGPIATRITPLLNRVIRRLSAEAVGALNDLSLAPLPLGGPALKILYRDPTPLQELRDASLLAAYRKRVQLLPMAAALVRQQLSPSQIHLSEDRLIEALKCWLDRGIANTKEKGLALTELACLLLRHHRLLATAELVLYHGWLSFHAGQILRLARRVQQVVAERPWASPETDIEAESGALLLHYYLAPYLGETIEAKTRRADYEHMHALVTAGQLKVEPLMEVHLIDHLMINRMNEDRYEEAQRLLEDCSTRLASLVPGDAELHATLLSKQASLYSEWSGYAESCGQIEEMRRKRSQTIEAYRESFVFLQRAEQGEGVSPLQQDTIKKKQASILNNLAYQLNRARRFAEALPTINQCIDLKKQGYADLDSLAASYGEKAQILAALGDFEEALRFDQLAREEIGRSADAGDTRSQADRWIYQVLQGRLYLLIGRADEAERLLRETLSQNATKENL